MLMPVWCKTCGRLVRQIEVAQDIVDQLAKLRLTRPLKEPCDKCRPPSPPQGGNGA